MTNPTIPILIRRGNKENLPSSNPETTGELRVTLDTNELFVDNGSTNVLLSTPDQTNNEGKFLNTDGSVSSWIDIDSSKLVGSWHEVSTEEERDEIPARYRKVGMAVRVTSTNVTYILNDDLETWTALHNVSPEEVEEAIDKEAKARLIADESIALTKLQDYLYTYVSIASDMSYEEAIKYFEENFHNRENVLTATIPYGACSSVRNGNFYGRNYDWYYNTNTTFVVYDKAQKDKYEFLGVAQSVLDEIDFDSETTIQKLRLIPYLILDGINEHNVFCNTNVVPTGDLGITTGTHPDLEGDYICQIMLPKYVLDHFSNATDAVNWIRDEAKIFAPRNATTQLELHFMVGDPNHTYIVEFVHNEAVISEVTNSKQEVMTNFYRYDASFDVNGHIDFDSVTNYGAGLERYNLLVDAHDSVDSIESMRNCMNLAQYTKAYTEIYTDPVAKIINPNTWKTEWAHDYSDSTILPHPMDLHANSPLSDYEYSGIFDVLYNMYQTRSRETGTTWQTVHSSVYDIERRELYLVVQENNKQYHFVCPTTPRILQNIDEEVARAKAAEAALGGDIAEEARIRTEEDQRLEGLIIEETSRATEAETNLQENLDTESQTRSDEDIRLEGLITTETERAEAKEEELNTAIEAEEQARIDADTELSNRITTNTEAIADINEELDTYGDIVTHNVNEFATAAQGDLADTALQPENVINDVQHTDVNLPLSANMGKELQDQIDNLKARGRYLSQWNAVTGQPATQPTELPYPYKTGDYYLVGTVGEVNYKPTGTSYTGAASTEIETAELGIDDVYFFDGTIWHLQQNTQKTITFASLAGSPYDNSNLAAALNTKVDKTTQASKIYGTDNSGNQTIYDKDSFGKVDDVKVDGTSVVTNKVANIDLTGKENVSNKTTTITSSSTDTQYPSAKATFEMGQDIREVAEGKTNSYVVSYEDNPAFNSQDSEITITDSFVDINEVTHSVDELKLGDSIYVKETDVPDRWCSNPAQGQILPEGYTQLEYIESTGTQWIKTNTKYTGNHYTVEWRATDNGVGATTLFACTSASPYSGGLCGNKSSRNLYIGNSGGISLGYTSNDDIAHKWSLTIDNTNAALVKDGVVVGGTTAIDGTIDTEHEIYLFCGGLLTPSSTSVTQQAQVKMYNWKLTDNGTLVADFIPAKRDSDNAIGMYDLVSNTFFANGGTGEFIAGPEIQTNSITLYKLETAKVPVTDVRVDGTSVINNTVANIDLTGKQDIISDLSTIRSGAALGATSIQPNDNVSELTNDANYQTGSQVTTSISTHNTDNTSHSDIRTAVASKSTVSVSATGTSTSEVQYITIDGIEKKLAGGSGSEEDNVTITKNTLDKIQAVGIINQNDNTTALKEWKGTLAEYNALSEYDDNIKYVITDDYDGGSSVYTKTEVDTLLSNKQDTITYTYDSTNEKMIIA